MFGWVNQTGFHKNLVLRKSKPTVCGKWVNFSDAYLSDGLSYSIQIAQAEQGLDAGKKFGHFQQTSLISGQ